MNAPSPIRACLAGLALLALAACGDRKAANADSTLSRDLSLANAPAVQPPVFQDTAVSPAPAAAKPQPREEPAPARTRARTQPPTQIATIPRPTQEQSQPQPHAQPQPPFPVAAGPAPLKKEIGAGTGVALTMGDRVCTNTNRPGDKLVATVNTAVMGSNGAVIPVGSTIVLEVASVTPGSSPETAQITFRVRSVVLNDQTYDVNAEVTPLGQLEKTKVANPDKDADKRKVIGGAIAGAIAGKILGGSTKATVIGAAAGAATGAAVSRNSDRYEACLAAGSGMRMTLNSPLIIS